MPYIKPERREVLDPVINVLLNTVMPVKISEVGMDGSPFLCDGDINYIITRIVAAHTIDPPMNDRYVPKYEDYQRAIGILECAKLEMYRVGAAPYEDEKSVQNGEVLRDQVAFDNFKLVGLTDG